MNRVVSRSLQIGMLVALLCSLASCEETSLLSFSQSYSIGDTGPAGGLIFYDKGSYSDGWQYLEAAPVGWSGLKYSTCTFAYQRNYLSNATMMIITGTAVGTGKANTTALVAAMGTDAYKPPSATENPLYAAKFCADYNGGGYNDWFLPSKDELNLMFSNLGRSGGFSRNTIYWSSSEKSFYEAWSQVFWGAVNYYWTRIPGKVWPARAF